MEKKSKKIKVIIDGNNIACGHGQMIMGVAKAAGIDIPGLCGHPDLPVKANCRLCVVDVRGKGKLVTACSTPVEDGMTINTKTEKVKKTRSINLELIFAEHIERCGNCIWRFECKLLSFAEKYKILITTFKDRKGRRSVHKLANAIEIDGSQCIDCRNCIDACSLLQNIHYLELAGKGADQEVAPTKNKKIDCILCGQCALHCPVSAAQEQSHWEIVEKVLSEKSKSKKKKKIIALISPAVVTSIVEDFGLFYNKNTIENIFAGLKKLGFDHALQVGSSAEAVFLREAGELLDRIQNGGVLPLISSSCPAWINYAEFYQPGILPHLSHIRSPHIVSGSLIKTSWAKQTKMNSNDITVVSITPCTAKKYEASRSELKIGGRYPVDLVLTARELSFLFKKHGIDLSKIDKVKKDDFALEDTSGIGTIGEGTGGQAEIVLRLANILASKEAGEAKPLRQNNFNKLRGTQKIKSDVIGIARDPLRVAVVNGISGVEDVLRALHDYDYIEIMACPDGCVGGGGQPIPTTKKIRQERISRLYLGCKSSAMGLEGENNEVKYRGMNKKTGVSEKSIFFTSFKKRIKY